MAMLSTKEVRMYLRIRNLCGLLGIILPWIALFSAGIVLNKPEGWWWSISATYYQSPALVGVLVPACIVMMSYIGYDWKDNLITTLTGVGFFQLPIEISQIIHTACALLFFLCAAVNTLCQFTKHGATMTDRKKVRNVIYRICGWGMVGFEALLVVLVLLGAPGWVVMVIEIILLHLFGFAWLVKGEFFPFLNDKEEDFYTLPEDGEPIVGAAPSSTPKIRMQVE